MFSKNDVQTNDIENVWDWNSEIPFDEYVGATIKMKLSLNSKSR